jgi:hypothetical protein
MMGKSRTEQRLVISEPIFQFRSSRRDDGEKKYFLRRRLNVATALSQHGNDRNS